MTTETMTVAERNAWFASLPPEQQRVQLAKDVLTHLQRERLCVKSGTYVTIENLSDEALNADVQTAIAEAETCTVCALGALFVTRVGGYDNYGGELRFEDLSWVGGRNAYAERWDVLDALTMFSDKQLSMIECAFEGCAAFGYADMELRKAAADAYLSVRDVRKRLELIMQNIIENNGTFVVPAADA